MVKVGLRVMKMQILRPVNNNLSKYLLLEFDETFQNVRIPWNGFPVGSSMAVRHV